jgi:hypothetical protein
MRRNAALASAMCSRTASPVFLIAQCLDYRAFYVPVTCCGLKALILSSKACKQSQPVKKTGLAARFN